MSRHEVYQRYLTKTLVVKIKEDKEMYMELRKEGKNAYCALSIIIKEPKVEEIISRYSYVFMEEVDLNTINEYIKNFLEDIEFRKNNSVLKEGVECNEVFNFTNESGTNIQCYNQVTKLNKQKDVSKLELSMLRTNGIDKFSKMSLDLIEEYIEPSVIQYFNKELKTKNNIVRACRWYMRGLKKEWCVEKVKVDNELSK